MMTMTSSPFTDGAVRALDLFYQINDVPQNPSAKIQALSKHLGCKVSFFGCGGEVTEDDKVGMLEEEFLIKSGLMPRPLGM